MLKALELHGFKSFADKTRFEFPDGITVVVGPNGSGKSNVVDGIRWVLGEQSAKSLRGSEMSDVIFKGSGSGQRRQANTAEVTIVFDNDQQLLSVDSTEVRVTRRVYRSGEGEYLINDEPCRLRDIRDLFRGTGVGSDAYSLIEQGKVDTLLQASPRERRAIFEEAAGISRFKAKKVESQRRLDRVEQNLLRLSDIVEEVDRRLKSLRNQATKARRYKEYTDRLKELRTNVSLTDFLSITDESAALETQLAELTSQISTLQTDCTKSEEETTSLDKRMESLKQESREVAGELAKVRDQISADETTSQLQRQTLVELEDESAKCRRRLIAVNSRAGDTKSQLHNVQRELSDVEQEFSTAKALAAEQGEKLESLAEQLRTTQDAERKQREQHAEQMSAVAKLNSQLSGLESELTLANRSIDLDLQRESQLKGKLDEATKSVEAAETVESELKSKLSAATVEQDKAQLELDEFVSKVAELTLQLSQTKQERAAAVERSNVLEEVERRLEGIGAGTKDLLARSKSGAIGPLSEVRGMVADLVEVKVEMAPLVDAALGERAQYVVVAGQRLIRATADGSLQLRGRVGLISLSSMKYERWEADARVADEDGVLGHATEFIQVDAAYSELADFLLGSTWFVRTAEVAIHLREKFRDKPWRFVTSAGEVLEADGTFFGGPRLSSGGIVSRRSELRSLQSQVSKLTEQENVLEQELQQWQAKKELRETQLRDWNEQRKVASDQFAEVHAKAEAARQVVQQLLSTRDTLESGIAELKLRQTGLEAKQAAALSGLGELESLVSSLESSLGKDRQQMVELRSQHQTQQQEVTATTIELAKVEQRLETLRMQALRFEQDNDDRAKAVAEIQSQLEQCQTRHRDTTQAVLGATGRLAEAYLELQACQRKIGQFRKEEDHISLDRTAKSQEARGWREQLHTLQQSEQALQLHAGELRMKKEAVAERLRDDYGIELSDLVAELKTLDASTEQGLSESTETSEGDRAESEADADGEESALVESQVVESDAEKLAAEKPADAEPSRDEIESEISALRRKINNIGAVNMESLAELEDLETRYGELSQQYEDLTKAKETLERIIQRINVDSRQMFEETLAVIRENFQSLFRRAFGGGQADIVVEEGVDILDAGIDIVATPPGKRSLNISLLSGGERALTAVTLLLAIFRHRPSPFCILDEVDGPLDEANIGRFVDVLKEFLATTKVVIVTHSKKTMSAATTLYGVTMQESGVSKRVSVRFNDVREDGSIRTDSDDGENVGDENAA